MPHDFTDLSPVEAQQLASALTARVTLLEERLALRPTPLDQDALLSCKALRVAALDAMAQHAVALAARHAR